MEIPSAKEVAQFKKEIKSQSTDDILTVLYTVQAIERVIHQELKSRS